jgi:hypothetical protein
MKYPSKSEIEPLSNSSRNILAPGMDSPVFESFMKPEIVKFWEQRELKIKNKKKGMSLIFI